MVSGSGQQVYDDGADLSVDSVWHAFSKLLVTVELLEVALAQLKLDVDVALQASMTDGEPQQQMSFRT